MNSNTSQDHRSTYTVLVTGANAGLGFATCCRLIDEFLLNRPESQRLCLIITTRDQPKSDDTLRRIKQHVKKHTSGAWEKRVQLQGQLLDLTSLLSVKALAERLVQDGAHINALVLNAGIGGWRGIDWPLAIFKIVTDLVDAATWPTYKLGYMGRVVKPQIAGQGSKDGDAEPRLGEVFTANVFGHYMLAHYLMPVLRHPSTDQAPARIIWVSSIEAQGHSFRLEDLQGLETDASYESSKRLTDLLALTADLPSTRPYTSRYLSAASGDDLRANGENPRMYLCHPGVCGTSIAGLNIILHSLMVAVFYVTRWIGSPWHPVTAYLGAVAPVWLALAPQSTLDGLEEDGGKGKWGSSTDRMGQERVIRTEVAGWGLGGKVGEAADGAMRSKKGRHRRAEDLTAEDREEFEETGRAVWKEMEALREDLEMRLGIAR